MGKYKKVDGVPTIAFPEVTDSTLVRGASGFGKTQYLIDRARALLDADVPAGSVLVLCATPDAADAFARRLDRPGVRVECARQFALDLLARPDAVRLFGHGPRVLLPYEEDILFEDLKVSGLELDRLQGMLSFFRRSMSEISDDHPDFLIDDDEVSVMGLLRRGLDLRGAYLEEQISANAARYLSTVGTKTRYEHVLVDDYQLLCRASQVMAGLLTRQSMCVAYDPTTCDDAYESYPYTRGPEELLDANQGAVCQVSLDSFRGSAAIARAIEAVRAESGMDEAVVGNDTPGSVLVEVLHNPDDEIARAADLIADALATKGLTPDEILVVSPARAWSERISGALESRGIPCSVARDDSGLLTSDADQTGDARYLRVLTALLLAGDDHDDAAWRSWCAFGDPLAASGQFDVIARFADEQGLRLHEALATYADGDALGIQVHELSSVIEAYREGLEIVRGVRGLSGKALLDALTERVCGDGEPVPSTLLELCRGMEDGDGARELRERILAIASAPGWSAEPAGTVRVAEATRLCGLTARLVIFVGFVNGFFPKHGFFDETVTPPGDVAAAHEKDARRLAAAMGKSSQDLAFTAFDKIRCDDAERLHLKIDRIALEKRVRMARVSPSIFCESLR